jgi:hypothetical protein
MKDIYIIEYEKSPHPPFQRGRKVNLTILKEEGRKV